MALASFSIRLGAVALGSVLLIAGCEDAPASSGRGSGGQKKAAAGAGAGAGAGETTTQRAAVAYRDEDFVESMTNRDPFRSYTTAFKADTPTGDITRKVFMPTTSVEEMRLIAIITGVPKPKAMLVDPLGVGHVVERGDYVGRPKVVQASGNVAMTLNWRVERIRDNEVVLTQEDAADPTRVALTKIIPLRDGTER